MKQNDNLRKNKNFQKQNFSTSKKKWRKWKPFLMIIFCNSPQSPFLRP